MDRSVTRALLAWYSRHARDFPWRRQPSAYGTLVSELMLQQTGTAVAAPRYLDFLRRFPNFRALARAAESEVLAAWSGLGYYARARRLHQAARAVVEQHGGELPRTIEQLRALPGVGPYTAAALAAIAHDIPAFALDGNAARVMARLLDERRRVDGATVRRRLQDEGEALVPARRAGDFAQAVMDLGATICVPRAPRCDVCVLRRWCAANAAGTAARLPLLPPPPRRRLLHLACVRIRRGAAVLLVPSPRGQLLAGTWVVPAIAVASARLAREGAQRAAARAGLRVTDLRCAGHVRHLLTHRQIVAHVFDVVGAGPPEGAVSGEWTDGNGLERLAVSSFTRRVLELAPAPARGRTSPAACGKHSH